MRYHFNTRNGHRFHDEDGIEVESVEAAKATAVTYLSELLRWRPELVWDEGRFTLEARSADGEAFDITVTASRPAE